MQRGTILVVDDELAIHGYLAVFLTSKGYHVAAATTADAAIDVLRTQSIDAIVLDVNMPERSGLAVLEYVRVRHHRPDLPVLIFTGGGLSDADEEAITRYRAYVFYKQEDPDDFASYIDRVTTAA